MQARTEFLQGDIVDLAVYPQNIRQHEANSVVTTGDLDGSFIKILYDLISEGVVKLPEEQYEKVYKLYHKKNNDIYPKDLAEFDEILASMEAGDVPVSAYLIGDDVCDRGMNDYYMLKLYQRLDELNIQHSILISNHGMEFLRQYAEGFDKPNVTLYKEQPFFGKSLVDLQAFIAMDLITAEEVNSLVEEHYLHKLRVAICDASTVHEDCYILYTHAPVTPYKMRELARSLGINDADYSQRKTYDLVKMVNRLNEELYEALISGRGRIEDLYDDVEIKNHVNDRYDDLHEKKIDKKDPFSPFIINVHGHVGENDTPKYVPKAWKYVNLDTNLAKPNTINIDEVNYLTRGKYITFISRPVALTLEKEYSSKALSIKKESILGTPVQLWGKPKRHRHITDDLPNTPDLPKKKTNI